METFIKNFSGYFDGFGFMCDGKHGRTSQNGTLFTAWYILCLIDHFDEDPEAGIDYLDYYDSERNRIVKAYSDCIMPDGSTVRFPGCKDLESTDNLVGWGVFGFFLSPANLRRVYGFAEREHWIWPSRNTIPEALERRWLGRMRQVVAHIKISLNIKTNLLESIWWASSVLSSLFKRQDFDAYALSYLLCRVEKESRTADLITTTARVIWTYVFKLKYKNGIHDVIESHWPNHSIIKYLKKFPS